MIAFACVGDANHPATFSGTIYHALTAAKRIGMPVRGLKLDVTSEDWKLRRVFWNLKRVATFRKRGGYQYSEDFLERLWAQDPPGEEEGILNFFQLYPSKLFEQHAGQKWFYIDQTLSQLFAGYAETNHLSASVKADAIAREKQQYHAADGVIAHSQWAAQDIIDRYGVPPEKVFSVICGANIDEDVMLAWEARRKSRACDRQSETLRLVFIGKDYDRKGLPRLVRALTIARERGVEARLVVIGPDQQDLPDSIANAPGVIVEGFIDKTTDCDRFLDIVGNCDVGCLLSEAEAGGISLREFGRFGLPVIAPNVGGAKEYVVPGAAQLFDETATDDRIADVIHQLASNREWRENMKQAAQSQKSAARWDPAITQIREIMSDR